MDRIKRFSAEVLGKHKSKFGPDFSDNKKALDQITIIRSKGLKNEIAGYITKYIKHEIHDQEIKHAESAERGAAAGAGEAEGAEGPAAGKAGEHGGSAQAEPEAGAAGEAADGAAHAEAPAGQPEPGSAERPDGRGSPGAEPKREPAG